MGGRGNYTRSPIMGTNTRNLPVFRIRLGKFVTDSERWLRLGLMTSLRELLAVDVQITTGTPTLSALYILV